MDFVCDMQIKPTVMSEFDIKKFIDFCVDNIGKIKDLLNCNFIRIAYSPQYEIEDASITELAEQFFKNTKFHDKEMTNYSMSNTFIKEEKVLDIPVEMNFLTNWSVAARRYKSAALGIESVQNVVVCTFDINTSPRQRINYNMDAIIDFYEKIQSWDEELMKNYLGARE